MNTLESLWRAVYAEPHNVDNKRVLADALLGAGDARGAFIHHQIKRAGGEPGSLAARQLEARMRKDHEDAWLGPLLGFVHRSGRKWRHGFLAAARLAACPSGWQEHREWSTVTELDCSTSPYQHARLAALPLRSLVKVTGLSIEEGMTTVFPWQTLGVWGGIMRGGSRVCALATAQYPKLQHLILEEAAVELRDPERYAPLWAEDAVASRVACVEVHASARAADWLQTLWPIKANSIRVRSAQWSLDAVRDRFGHRSSVRVSNRGSQASISELASLIAGLSAHRLASISIVLDARRKPAPDDDVALQQLRDVLTRHAFVECELPLAWR